MKSFLTFVVLVASCGCAFSAENTRPDFEVFRAFFSRKDPIASADVRARFGSPDAYAPLRRNEKSDEVTPDNSWLVYNLKDEVVVTVGVEKGTVKAVTHQSGSSFMGFLYQRLEIVPPKAKR